MRTTVEDHAEPSGLYKSIIKRIKDILLSRRFHHRSEASELDHEVCDIVKTISENLAAFSIEDAVLALKFIVANHAKIIESFDTSDGVVYPELQYAASELGRLWSKIEGTSPRNIAKYAFERILNNGYSIFDNIVEDFQDVLGQAGLRALEKLIRTNIKEGPKDDYEKRTLKRALEAFSDVEGDVDKFVALQNEFENSNPDYAKMESAKRLARAGRAEEALALLDGMTSVPVSWAGDIDSIRLKALEDCTSSTCPAFG